MRVLVCGGRHYGEMPRGVTKYTSAWYRTIARIEGQREFLFAELDRLAPRPAVIIHGAARGADRLADVWARRHGIPTLPFAANWYPNGRAGGLDKGAGPKRNQRMIDEGKPDLVIAFKGGTGTADLVRRARSAGIQVIEKGE